MNGVRVSLNTIHACRQAAALSRVLCMLLKTLQDKENYMLNDMGVLKDSCRTCVFTIPVHTTATCTHHGRTRAVSHRSRLNVRIFHRQRELENHTSPWLPLLPGE